MKKLIIYGIGEYAEIAHYYFQSEGIYNVECFVVDKEFYEEKRFLGLEVKTFDEIENNISQFNDYKFFVAIGFSNQNTNRKNVFNKIKNLGFKFASYISKDALIADNVVIGKNAFILEQNNLQPFVKIGDNVVLWSGNHIGHHSVIDDHTFITSHAVISGGVKIGSQCFIGVNATIVDHVVVKNNAFIKANSLIKS
tara:strand:+ start:632 stop:1219 length:588 start_codon:yes stop_codon:yes gene_type:complete